MRANKEALEWLKFNQETVPVLAGFFSKCWKPVNRVSHDELWIAGVDGVTVRHFVIDLTDEGALERALQGCHTVVHCAHATMPWTYADKKTTERFWSDNLTGASFLNSREAAQKKEPKCLFIYY